MSEWLQTDSLNRFYKLSYGEHGSDDAVNYREGVDNLFNKVWRDAAVNFEADYGADPTGVTDCATLLASAVATGKPVYIGEGTFLLQSLLAIITDYAWIFGPGTLKADAASFSPGDSFITINAGNVIIEDIKIDQNNMNNGRSISIGGTSAQRTTIRNVKSVNCQAAFVEVLDSASYTWVLRCEHRSKGTGVLVNDANGSSDLFVIGNYFDATGKSASGDGININCPTHGFENFLIAENRIVGMVGESAGQGIGIAVANSPHGDIFRNYIQTTEHDGIHVENGSDYVTVALNRIRNTGTNSPTSGNGLGIAVSDCDFVTVAGNKITGVDDAIGILIRAADNGSDDGNSVIDNTLFDIEFDGIRINGQRGFIVEGNQIFKVSQKTASTYNGIVVDDIGGSTSLSQDGRISGNVIADSGNATKWGIFIDSSVTVQNDITIEDNNLTRVTNKLSVHASSTSIEVGKNKGAWEETATGTFTLSPWGITKIDSSGGAVTGTLGNGQYIGQIKTIAMTDATNSSTVSITNHETSDPEVATFDAVDETGIFMWTGTEWVTIKATCTFV